MKSRKRVIHIEMNEETYVDTDGINKGLKRMAMLSEDSNHLSDILGKAVENFLISLPNGQENYSGENPKIGKISFGLNLEKPHVAEMIYDPSSSCNERFTYDSLTIGTVDIEKKTFSTYWNKEHRYDEAYWNIPKTLMKDTEKLIKFLGLKRKKQ